MLAFHGSHHVFAQLLLVPCLALGTGVESFEQDGSAWIGTLFPNLAWTGGALFVRDALGSGLAAPDTTPPLPINVGGDKAARCFEVAPRNGGAIAIGERVYCDVELDGYVAFGYPDAFGSRLAGFLLRGGSAPSHTAYSVEVVHNGGTTALLALSFMCNGIVAAPNVLATSQAFPVDLTRENYRLTASVQGTLLRARLRRVFVSGGVVVEEPIDLLPAPGIRDELVATSTLLFEGTVGSSGFACGASSVFFDDVRITDLSCGPGITYCSGDGSTLPCPCANDARRGEGCKNSNDVGARLVAVGSTSVAKNDLRLGASQLATSGTALFFTGTTTQLAAFGDGLRCVGGAVVRLGAQVVNCGTITRTNIVPSLGVSSGATRYFQTWYRNPSGPCGLSFNLTHGLELTFSP